MDELSHAVPGIRSGFRRSRTRPGSTRLLAVGCATHAVTRHSGTMLLTRSEAGPPTLVRERAPTCARWSRFSVLAGYSPTERTASEILREALGRRAPRSLAPRDPAVAIDDNYILAAAGLLATHDPEAAMRLLRRELRLSPTRDRVTNSAPEPAR